MARSTCGQKRKIVSLRMMKNSDFFVDASKDDGTIQWMLAICMYCHQIGATDIIVDDSNLIGFLKKVSKNKWLILE